MTVKSSQQIPHIPHSRHLRSNSGCIVLCLASDFLLTGAQSHSPKFGYSRVWNPRTISVCAENIRMSVISSHPATSTTSALNTPKLTQRLQILPPLEGNVYSGQTSPVCSEPNTELEKWSRALLLNLYCKSSFLRLRSFLCAVWNEVLVALFRNGRLYDNH